LVDDITYVGLTISTLQMLVSVSILMSYQMIQWYITPDFTGPPIWAKTEIFTLPHQTPQTTENDRTGLGLSIGVSTLRDGVTGRLLVRGDRGDPSRNYLVSGAVISSGLGVRCDLVWFRRTHIRYTSERWGFQEIWIPVIWKHIMRYLPMHKK